MQKMRGYKPPHTTRVCIQPEYFKIWDRTWKNGSIALIAIGFIRDKYESLDKHGKYRYILDIIQIAMLQLSDECNWDKSIYWENIRNGETQIVLESFIRRVN